MNHIDLGKRIRQERILAGMTQEQLAEAVNVSSTYIGYIERGERSVTLDKLIQLANVFHVSVDFLLQDSVSFPTSASDTQLLRLWNSASSEQKNLILSLIKSVLSSK